MSLDWQADALCAQVDPELFFPKKSGTAAPARKICGRCDVREQCLEWALSTDDATGGVLGGLTARQRDRLRRDRKLKSPHQANRDAAIDKARALARAGVAVEAIAVDLAMSERTILRWIQYLPAEAAA